MFSSSFNIKEHYTEEQLIAILKKWKLNQFISNNNKKVLDSFTIPHIVQYVKGKKYRFWRKDLLHFALNKLFKKEEPDEYDVVADPLEAPLQLIYKNLENEMNKSTKSTMVDLSEIPSSFGQTELPFNVPSRESFDSTSVPPSFSDLSVYAQKVRYGRSDTGKTTSSRSTQPVIDLIPVDRRKDKNFSALEKFLYENWKSPKTLSLEQYYGGLLADLYVKHIDPNFHKRTEITEKRLFEPDKETIYEVDEKRNQANQPPHLAFGGQLKNVEMLNQSKKTNPTYMASGGRVDDHPGDPKGKDTIPAWLSPNEYVINAQSAEANKSLLDKINQTSGPIYLASGGPTGKGIGGKFIGFLRNLNQDQQLNKRIAAGDPKALRIKSEKEISQFLGKTEERINAPFNLMGEQGERAGNILSNMGSMAPGVIGEFIKGIGESIETLRSWNDQLLKSNLQFSEFSASMASVAASQEVRNIQLTAARGERRAEVAGQHALSSFELEKRLSVFEDAFANVKGSILTSINEGISIGIDKLIDALGMAFPDIAQKIKSAIGMSDTDPLEGQVPYSHYQKLIEVGYIKGNAQGERETFDDLPRRFNP